MADLTINTATREEHTMATTRDELVAELALTPPTGGTDRQNAWATDIYADLTDWAMATIWQLRDTADRLEGKGKPDSAAALRESCLLLITLMRRANRTTWLIAQRSQFENHPNIALAALADTGHLTDAFDAANKWVPRRASFAKIKADQ